MPPLDLTPDAWAQIRHDYEHTDRTVDDICAEHGISAGTLRDRMRRWNWTRRRPPVPREGPPAIAVEPVAPAASFSSAAPTSAAPASVVPVQGLQPQTGAPDLATAAPGLYDAVAGPNEPLDEKAILLRLQGTVARILPVIEGTVAKLGAGALRPREMESGVRTLATLTRTLRELNGLLGARQATAADDDIPEDMDAFRIDLARRIDAFVASRTAEDEGSKAG